MIIFEHEVNDKYVVKKNVVHQLEEAVVVVLLKNRMINVYNDQTAQENPLIRKS